MKNKKDNDDMEELFKQVKDATQHEYPKHLLDGTRDEFRLRASRASRQRRVGTLFLVILFCIILLAIYAILNWDKMIAQVFVAFLNGSFKVF